MSTLHRRHTFINDQLANEHIPPDIYKNVGRTIRNQCWKKEESDMVKQDLGNWVDPLFSYNTGTVTVVDDI